MAKKKQSTPKKKPADAKRAPRNNPNKGKPGKKRLEREAAAAAEAAGEAKPAA